MICELDDCAREPKDRAAHTQCTLIDAQVMMGADAIFGDDHEEQKDLSLLISKEQMQIN